MQERSQHVNIFSKCFMSSSWLFSTEESSVPVVLGKDTVCASLLWIQIMTSMIQTEKDAWYPIHLEQYGGFSKQYSFQALQQCFSQQCTSLLPFTQILSWPFSHNFKIPCNMFTTLHHIPFMFSYNYSYHLLLRNY